MRPSAAEASHYAQQQPEDLPEKPRKKPVTAPNQSVILIGLPQACGDEDLKSFIDDFKTNANDPSPVENATIVLDKMTGQSKRFGFVRFITLEHSRGTRLSIAVLAYIRLKSFSTQHSSKPILTTSFGSLADHTISWKMASRSG